MVEFADWLPSEIAQCKQRQHPAMPQHIQGGYFAHALKQEKNGQDNRDD